MKTKICIGCGKRKPLSKFYKNGKTFTSNCKLCQHKLSIQWAKDNPLKNRAKALKWYYKNKK